MGRWGLARRFWRFAVAFLLLASTSPVSAQPVAKYAVLLDASKSMTGFYHAKLLNSPWKAVLQELDGGASEKWQFGNSVVKIRGPLKDVTPIYDNTALDVPLQQWLDVPDTGDAVVMVTDNVADTSDSVSWDAQQRFYNLLRNTQKIAGVTLIPAVLPFQGTVTAPKNSPRATYAGERAIAFYVIHRVGADKSDRFAFERMVSGILQRHNIEHELIRIMPFGESWDKSKPSIDLKIESGSGADIRLDPKWGLIIGGLEMNQGVKLSFQAEVTPGPNFEMRNAELSASIALESDADLASQQFITAKVNPRQANFRPREGRKFDVEFEIAPVGFFSGVSLARQIELAFSTSTTIQGEIVVHSKVHRQGVLFVGPEAERWSYNGAPEGLGSDNREIHRRLYRVQELVQGMVPADGLDDEIVRRRVWIELRYSTVALGLLVVAAIFVLLPLAWLLRQAGKPRHFEVASGMAKPQPVTLGLFSTSPVQSDDGRCSLALTWLGCALLVRAQGGRILGSQLRSAAGGMVRVAWRDGEMRDTYSFQVTKQKNGSKNGPRHGGQDW